MHEALIIHAMLTMKMGGQRIVLTKHIKGVYQVIPVAKKSIDALTLLIVDTLKALLGDESVFLHQSLVNIELLYTIETRILEGLRARHTVSLHGVGNA